MTGFRLIAAALLLGLTGCQDRSWNDDALSADAAYNQTDVFFPRSLLEPEGEGGAPVLDQVSSEYLGTLLVETGEAPLPVIAQEIADDDLLLRFIWLPSFDNKVVVRVSVTHIGHQLTAYQIPSDGAENPERKSVSRFLSAEEAEVLDSLIQASRIFSEPAADPRGLPDIDGAEWVVELADAEHYHLLRRWSPDDGPVREIGTAMLELTGWEFAAIY
jgi:hypothetical protein